MDTTAWTTADAVASFTNQGRLEPGQEGWWKVWGANVRHILPGDLVCSKAGDDVAYDLVQDLFVSKSAPLRQGLVVDGERITLGALCPIVLFRRGTRNTLAAP